MRSINSSQHAFSSSCANGFYAATFTDLHAPAVGGAPFISPDLMVATPVKSGYDFSMVMGSDAVPGTLGACNGVPAAQLVTTYVARGGPQSVGLTGQRYYWTSTLGTIYFDPTTAIPDTAGNTPPVVVPPAGPLQ
jgi:hypothetical protein